MRVAMLVVACSACGVPAAGVPDAGGDAGREQSVDAGAEQGVDAGSDAGTVTPDAGPLTTRQFDEVFLGDSFGSCTKPAALVGYEPDTPGLKYPLFIYTVGTLDNWGKSASFPYDPARPNQIMLAILREAAAHGLVAASVEYDNFFLLGCNGLRLKTHCLYDPAEPSSAVAKLCARANVDCSKGIIVAGHSQGAQLATYAKNWDGRVRAVWGLGATSDFSGSFGSGDQPGLSNETGTADDRCLRDDMTTIDRHAVRLVDGLNEVCYPTSSPPYDPQATNPAEKCGPASSQGELERMSGKGCAAAAMSCLESNGSGWLIVPNEATQGGSAHHTWFAYSPDGGTEALDTGFGPPSTNPWSVSTNVEWLKGFLGGPSAVPQRIDVGAATAYDGPYSKDPLPGTFSRIATPVDVTAANAPVEVYQSYRTGAVRYTFEGLLPNASYVARLHFAEPGPATTGSRRFHVRVQGVRREVDLDVFAESGGLNVALAKTYSAISDANGRVVVELESGSAGVPLLNGLDFF